MSAEESVSQWLGRLQQGEREAAEKLWGRYFRRLVGLARQKLEGLPRRAADEEDVALSAFHSFCRGAEKGQFPRLTSRDNLWLLLVTITVRKAQRLARHEGRQKRGGYHVLDQSVLGSDELGLGELLSTAPSPEFAAQVAEEYRALLARLPQGDLPAVAQWKMEGFSNEEIAANLGCALRSVERKLRVIRSLFSAEDQDEAKNLSD
jgi:DNA-directed RNA polymerase specialized sigma24 family protein